MWSMLDNFKRRCNENSPIYKFSKNKNRRKTLSRWNGNLTEKYSQQQKMFDRVSNLEINFRKTVNCRVYFLTKKITKQQ